MLIVLCVIIFGLAGIVGMCSVIREKWQQRNSQAPTYYYSTDKPTRIGVDFTPVRELLVLAEDRTRARRVILTPREPPSPSDIATN